MPATGYCTSTPARPATRCTPPYFGGLPEAEVARAERLISTAVLGVAVSEATGRFRQHDQSVVDADFAELLRWLRLALELSGAARNHRLAANLSRSGPGGRILIPGLPGA